MVSPVQSTPTTDQLPEECQPASTHDTARSAPKDALLDRVDFVLGPEACERLTAFLDNPPPPGHALRQLLRRKPPWQEGQAE